MWSGSRSCTVCGERSGECKWQKETKGVKPAECGLGRAQYTESGLMREKMARLTSLAEMFSRQTLPHYNS